jgi:hypothetical protein
MFPKPVQLMIRAEMKEGNTLYDTDDTTWDSMDDDVTCTCRFYAAYQVPCRHIWANHLTYNCLNDNHFAMWSHMWEGSGFDIYERMEKTYFEHDIDDDIGVPQRRRLEVRDALEKSRPDIIRWSKRPPICQLQRSLHTTYGGDPPT